MIFKSVTAINVKVNMKTFSSLKNTKDPWKQKARNGEFPGSPVVTIHYFHFWEPGFNP